MKKTVIAMFGVLAAVLLVGQRFGVLWAGGTGYISPVQVVIADQVGAATVYRMDTSRLAAIGEEVVRGEMIVTGPETFARVAIGTQTELLLAQNSRVLIDNLTPGSVEIFLQAGRMHVLVADRATAPTIRTGWTFTKPSVGETAFVYYDFQDTLVIAPLSEQPTAISLRATNEGLVTQKPVSIHEVAPISINDISFSPSAGDATTFFEWIQ